MSQQHPPGAGREQVQVLRRIAERGLKLAHSGLPITTMDGDDPARDAHREHLDLWRRMLDEIERLTTRGE